MSEDDIKELEFRKKNLLMLCRRTDKIALEEHRKLTTEEQTFYDRSLATVRTINTQLDANGGTAEEREERAFHTVAGGHDQPGEYVNREVMDANSKLLTR